MRENERLKGIRYPTQPKPTFEVFDLSEDPGEIRDLSAAKPPGVSLLYAAIDLYLSRETPTEDPELDEETLEKLRSLGYVD